MSKSLKLNAFFNVVRNVLRLIFPLITFPYVSRVLMPEGIGKVNFANSIISYFILLGNLGISGYATREASKIKNDKIIASQYFLRDYIEEPNIIESYMNHLDEDSIHVTFNGKTFDVPFIKNRCIYNRMDHNLDLPHLDLMYFAKNLWKDMLPNCQLQTIEEEIFNITRIDDVPGQYIPGYYDTYLSTNNIGPVVPIIEHNCQDIISLASFLEKMYEDVN